MRLSAILLLVAMACLCLVEEAIAQPDKSLPQPPGRFPIVDNDEAWSKLPRENPPLPPWARVLVVPLPKTTAKMLELDYFHREKNPLGAVLAGKLRWTAAQALGCKYGVASAEDDLRRAGLTKADVTDLAKPTRNLPPAEQHAIAFARTLTVAGYTITDEQFAELLKHYPPDKVTAIVHTVAYANFQNRIILGLGADGDPVHPIKMQYEPSQLAKIKPPARPPWEDLKSGVAEGFAVKVEWGKAAFDDLNLTLEKQKGRTLRIPLPDESSYKGLTTRESESAKRILWNTVSMGYQPEMTRAWFACLYAYYEEAIPDRVFTNSVFWVVTRTNDCFY